MVKTLLLKAFAKSMGISENITSPTFNIIKEYDGEEGYKLYHMDVYRLSESKEDIGISEYFNKGGVTIIEWADLISDILPKDRLDIRIKIVDENNLNKGYDAILVLGAGLRNGKPSPVLKDRLDMAYKLYENGYSRKNNCKWGIMAKKYYDEVNVMKKLFT